MGRPAGPNLPVCGAQRCCERDDRAHDRLEVYPRQNRRPKPNENTVSWVRTTRAWRYGITEPDRNPTAQAKLVPKSTVADSSWSLGSSSTAPTPMVTQSSVVSDAGKST